MTKVIHTDKAPQPIGPYSQAIAANGLLFCSGQVGVNPETKTIEPDIETQAHQTMKNLENVLKAGGSELQYVVKTTIFLTSITDFAKINAVYEHYFSDHKPARSTVEISKLPQGNFSNPPLVEIEAVAIIP